MAFSRRNFLPHYILPPATGCNTISQLRFFILFIYLFLSFVFSKAARASYGGSQARGQIGAVATGLRHSHSNMGSELCLQPTPQHSNARSLTQAARPGIVPAASHLLLRYVSAEPEQDLPILRFHSLGSGSSLEEAAFAGDCENLPQRGRGIIAADVTQGRGAQGRAGRRTFY